jgi:hypothetical protein
LEVLANLIGEPALHRPNGDKGHPGERYDHQGDHDQG